MQSTSIFLELEAVGASEAAKAAILDLFDELTLAKKILNSLKFIASTTKQTNVSLGELSWHTQFHKDDIPAKAYYWAAKQLESTYFLKTEDQPVNDWELCAWWATKRFHDCFVALIELNGLVISEAVSFDDPAWAASISLQNRCSTDSWLDPKLAGALFPTYSNKVMGHDGGRVTRLIVLRETFGALAKNLSIHGQKNVDLAERIREKNNSASYPAFCFGGKNIYHNFALKALSNILVQSANIAVASSLDAEKRWQLTSHYLADYIGELSENIA